ncbi:hypothetical protein [Streptosporangium roseum]|uniref:hypothetical protein n=1 Tax=Streptosporangium roseum TaxID=2001 RepID=UPI0033205F0F
MPDVAPDQAASTSHQHGPVPLERHMAIGTLVGGVGTAIGAIATAVTVVVSVNAVQLAQQQVQQAQSQQQKEDIRYQTSFVERVAVWAFVEGKNEKITVRNVNQTSVDVWLLIKPLKGDDHPNQRLSVPPCNEISFLIPANAGRYPVMPKGGFYWTIGPDVTPVAFDDLLRTYGNKSKEGKLELTFQGPMTMTIGSASACG